MGSDLSRYVWHDLLHVVILTNREKITSSAVKLVGHKMKPGLPENRRCLLVSMRLGSLRYLAVLR